MGLELSGQKNPFSLLARPLPPPPFLLALTLKKIDFPKGSHKKSSSTNGKAIKALPPPRAPSSLMAIGTFFFLGLKYPKTDFVNFFSPHTFWTKIALFFGKYCNNQVKMPTDKL